MSYNLDEHLGDNHYNCPVVAYYPEVIAANMPAVRTDAISSMITWASTDRKVFPKKLTGILAAAFPGYHRPRGSPRRATPHTMPMTHTWRTFVKRAKR